MKINDIFNVKFQFNENTCFSHLVFSTYFREMTRFDPLFTWPGQPYEIQDIEFEINFIYLKFIFAHLTR